MTAPTKADFFARDAELYDGRRQLMRTTDPEARAVLLDREADITWARALIRDAVFGPGDDSTTAVELADEARMLRILAEVERERVHGPWLDLTDGGRRFLDLLDDRGVWLEMAVSRWLAEYVVGVVDRAELHGAAYDAWLPLVGGQAAETVACLPVGTERGRLAARLRGLLRRWSR